MRSTLIKRSQHPFRVFALPLARLPRSHPTSQSATTTSSPSDTTTTTAPARLPTPLILFHISQPEADTSKAKPPIYDRALQKASEQWLKLGEKDKKSWMYWFWAKGEGLMDKIEYEEWALKGIVEGQGVKVVKEGEGVQEKIEIPLLYPTLKDQPLPHLLPQLHRHLLHRIPYHRKKMYQALIASPFTAPFALIPIIPNFPLFYVLWRAWSHYKAWRGATYLEQLVKLGMITEKPSSDLDKVYYADALEAASGGIEIGREGKDEKVRLTQKKIDNEVKDLEGSGVHGEGGIVGGKEAPDGTSTPESLIYDGTSTHSKPTTPSSDPLPPQAEGKGPAPDGTSTPKSLIYPSSSATSNSTSPSNSSQRVSPAKSEAAKPRHPSLLLSATQLPLLQKTFGLRPSEIVDITRAVEQADLRLKEADKSTTSGGGSGEKAHTEETGEKGTEWRGNLHR